MRPARLLAVDDDPFFRDLFRECLLGPDREVQALAPAEAVALAGAADLWVGELPGDGLAFLRSARERHPDLAFVVVGAGNEAASAAAAMRAGAADYLAKPVERDALAAAAERALASLRRDRERRRLSTAAGSLVEHQALWRRLLELAGILDLDRLGEAALRVLLPATGVAGGAVWLAGPDGVPVLRTARGVEPAPPERLSPGADPQVEGLRLPLTWGGEPVGLILLAGEVDQVRAERARTIADFVTAGAAGARRLAAALAGTAPGLRGPDAFVDHAGRAVAEARRYGRPVAIATVLLGPGAADPTALVADVARDADLVARIAPDELRVLLPETDALGAAAFRRRLLRAAGPRLSVGVAALPADGTDLDALVHRSRSRARDSLRSPLRRYGLDRLGFWETVEVLLAGTVDGAAGRTLLAGPEVIGTVGLELARERGRDPSARSLLYAGVAEGLHAGLPFLAVLPPATAARVVLLGRRAGPVPAHPAAVAVPVDGDARLAGTEFLLDLSGRGAYALLRRAGAGEQPAFHTSDPVLVDHLVARLEEGYELASS